ncbi:hypothetical protein DE146DRAFT_791630 [Phaeosphaeria sp. MPI-PUGE-AT-0046c]|nr:hypothetical protein DE146DRAFT_791630 [Phaeosphaeria sp. MPI-PUGE-AT-0046c]
MAITDTFPAVKAEVLISGVALQEYEDDDNSISAKTVIKHIEAVSGAEFAVRYKVDGKPKYAIRVDLFLDGKKATGNVLQHYLFTSGSHENTVTGVNSNQGGKWLLSKFSFSDLRTVDSAGRVVADQLMKDLRGMGQITLEFHYIVNVRATGTTYLREMKKSGLGEVPEKALKGKALSHQATLRSPVPADNISIVDSDYLDPKRRPFASITFKYRLRDALKALLIIPRSPSPVPLEERDVDSLSSEEMRELLQRQRAREAAAPVVKQERGIKRESNRDRDSTMEALNEDDDDVTFVSTKRSRLLVTLNEDGVETIDLT